MAKYRTKPIEVEAAQWFPDVKIEGVEYPPLSGTPQGRAYLDTYGPCALLYNTNGRHTVMPGDWVLTGPDGDRWTVYATDFVAIYEAAD